MNARQKYKIFMKYSLSVKRTFANDVPFLLSSIALESKQLNNSYKQNRFQGTQNLALLRQN